MKSESKQKFKCKFCGVEYSKESTLVAHSCEQKRRHQQKDETGVQWGFNAYIRFYKMTQSASATKTYEDFSKSQFYTAFVKYGRYCVGIRCINVNAFTDWLLTNNKKIDYWCSDKMYEQWMIAHLQKEAPQDALERALKEMQQYAESNPELQNDFNNYFRTGNVNRIMHHISAGRISPWVVFNCDSGINFLGGLAPEQATMIWRFIDTDIWQKKFKDYPDEVKWVKGILTQAGL